MRKIWFLITLLVLVSMLATACRRQPHHAGAVDQGAGHTHTGAANQSPGSHRRPRAHPCR